MTKRIFGVRSFLQVLTWSLVMALVPLSAAAEGYGQSEAPLVATVLGTEVRTSDPQEMQFIVIGKLLDRYAAGEGIAVTSGEVAEYLAAQERFMAGDRQRREARRVER